ncbi:MAG: hypothetical protein M3167_16995 [Acidobacteriota bacterium]|nr:hypothetical protein [Acidobacteriota bacterium]
MTAPRAPFSLLLTAALALAPAALAQQPASAAKKAGAPKKATATAAATPKIEFEKYTLPNGLQVILHVDRKLPIVNVEPVVPRRIEEREAETNRLRAPLRAHDVPGDRRTPATISSRPSRPAPTSRRAASTGRTNNDRTNYFATVPSGILERILWLESDRLATLADALTKEKVDNQRDVVKNERRQGLENTPYGRWFKLTTENLHPASHPYS